MLSMILISSLVTFSAVFFLKFNLEVSSTIVEKGDIIKINLIVTNRTIFLYPHITVKIKSSYNSLKDQTNKKRFSVLTYCENVFIHELLFKYRGLYKVGIDYIKVSDLLGLFEIKLKNLPKPIEITVRPQIISIDSLKISKTNPDIGNFITTSWSSEMEQSEEVIKYTSERMSDIHWKLTAKMNEIMVKKSINDNKNWQKACGLESSKSYRSINLIIDLQQSHLEEDLKARLEDNIIETATSVAYFFTSQDTKVKLYYWMNSNLNICEFNGQDFEPIYEILTVMKFEQNFNINKVLELLISENRIAENILLITGNIDIELCNTISSAKIKGNSVTVIFISDDSLKEDTGNYKLIKHYLKRNEIVSYFIKPGDDIKPVLENGYAS
jgi:hypothetical protein